MKGLRWILPLAAFLALAVLVGAGQAQSAAPEDGYQTDSVDVAGNLPWQHAELYGPADVYAGRYVDLAISPQNGVVYVSYYHSTSGNLMVAHSVEIGTGNCGPSNSWYCETVDSGGMFLPNDDVGQFTSIDVRWVDRILGLDYNQVGVSYYNATDGTLKYAEYYCTPTIPFTCSWSTEVVDSATDPDDEVGKYSSLKLTSDGDPVIAYHYYDDPDGMAFASYTVRYAYYAGGGTGNCGDDSNWECEGIHSSVLAPTGTDISLDLNYEDSTYIAFNNGGELMYAWYYGFGGDCTNDEWNCVTIDDGGGGSVGQFASLHAPDDSGDHMQVAYYDFTDGKVMYAINVGSGGNCTSGAWNCFAVDTVGDEITQLGLSLSVDSEGSPIIAYQHDNQEMLSIISLKVARPAGRTGELIGNCGDVPPGMLFMYWYCQSIDSGVLGWSTVADYAAVGVNSDGMAYVAYYQVDDYYMDGSLMIAWQDYYKSFLPYLNKTP